MNENNYKKMLEYFRARKKAANVLIWQNRIITSVFYIMYPVLLIMQIVKRQQWFFTAVTAGVSFVVVSVFRYLYNKTRPYEVYNEKPLINKTTKGKSFPSRHVFCLNVIAMCWLYYCLPVGIIMLVLGAAMAATRVLTGVHFVSDVLAGALIGIMSGIAGALILL